MGGVRRWEQLAVLNKIETTYRTDATPAAADAILLSNVSFTPMDGTEIQRARMLPYMGNQGVILAGLYARLEGDIELAGAGAAGTVPRYGSVLRAAGLAETIAAGVSVTYDIVEAAQESASLYFISDKVRHIILGARTNLTLSWTALDVPRIRVTWVGLLGTIADVASMPAVSDAAWMTPLPVEEANTVLEVHGWSAVAESLSLDLGNTLTPRFLIGDSGVPITARSATGTAVVEARSIATIDWFARSKARTRAPLSITHGVTAGNIVEVTAPAVEIGKPAPGEKDGIANYSLPLALCPVSGRDELKIIVR